MDAWLTIERERAERRATEIAANGCAAACESAAQDVRLAVEWTNLTGGNAVLQLAAGAGCHTRALADHGLLVTALEQWEVLARLAAQAVDGQAVVLHADFDWWRSEQRFKAVLLFEATVFTFWDVEEIHRLRLRKIRELLTPGGGLIFGASAALGKAPLEWERVAAHYGDLPGAARALREMHETGQFMHYQAAQARTVLEQCGFELLRIHNGFTAQQPYAHWSPGMVFVCRRR